MKQLTVFTPTYNRAHTLKRLYTSLLKQASDSFCWLVIDDGSTDGTEELIRSFISEREIEILYYKQPNGGKQRAHNNAVGKCETELFMCLDSDDYLVPGAVSSILEAWKRVAGDRDVAGLIAPKRILGREPVGKGFPTHIEYSTVWDLYARQHFQGETALVYRTDILRHFLFPVAPGEKFISECYLHNLIDRKYKMALLPKVLMICEYLPDGYTNNNRALIRNNPIGYMRVKRLEMEMTSQPFLKMKSVVLYLTGAYFSDSYWKYWRLLPNKLAAVACILPSVLLANTEFKK